mgnify:CR=1 FL=1
MELIDTHCHIGFPTFEGDLDEIASNWRKSGVVKLLHACVEPSGIPLIRSLADRFDELSYSVGVHPLDTEHWNSSTVSLLRKAALDDKRVLAIGELGLDLFKSSNLNEQISVLRPQLMLASELNLPVIVHCRDAAAEMIKELRTFNSSGNSLRGVMHCWGGTVSEMNDFLELGFFISFSGTVTFPKAEQIHLCASEVPQERFLIETDCPFLAPVPKRGKRNEPAYVHHVAGRIAAIRGQTIEMVAKSTTENAQELFGFP